jgi:hypothetical protein
MPVAERWVGCAVAGWASVVCASALLHALVLLGQTHRTQECWSMDSMMGIASVA